jgi:NMD protein affecting ribosome stability and mRNA decay
MRATRANWVRHEGGEAMKRYGIISPVPTTDNLIYECFECLSEADQRAFVKKFKEQTEGT